MKQSYDIIIIGAGLIGTSFALSLQNKGLKIALLETHLPNFDKSTEADTRPLSLAYSSQVILNTLGIWSELADLATPIKEVHVSEQKRFGTIHFQAKEEHVKALGYVVPFDALRRVLYQRVAQQAGVTFVPIQALKHIQNSAVGTAVTIDTVEGEKTLGADLLIGADGTHSTTRQLLGIDVTKTDSDEVALTATLERSQPHQQLAYERFTSSGILALLPLRNPNQYRLVWTLQRTLADTVATWSNEKFAAFVHDSFHHRLDDIRVLERGQQFPLLMQLAREHICPGAVLLGNAAHTIYPLAAQGFNLGLRDAVTLSDVLLDAKTNGENWADMETLSRYQKWRRQDQHWITRLTNDISQLFELHVPLLGSLRSVGLLATDLLPPIKHRLAKRFMGMSGRLPRLARGITL